MGTKVISLTEGRKNLLRLADEARDTFDRFVFTRRGRPEAVLLGYEDYESLMETLEIHQTPGLVSELRKRAREVKRGKAVSRKPETRS